MKQEGMLKTGIENRKRERVEFLWNVFKNLAK
jgi:hypothetical protein